MIHQLVSLRTCIINREKSTFVRCVVTGIRSRSATFGEAPVLSRQNRLLSLSTMLTCFYFP